MSNVADTPRLPADTPKAEDEPGGKAKKKGFLGVKLSPTILGWLGATGTAVVLSTLLDAAGVAVGAVTDAATEPARRDEVSILSAAAYLAVILVAYYAGGYIAGRMARSHGMRHGIGVWAWGILTAVALAIVELVAGTDVDVLAEMRLPPLPIGPLSTATGWSVFTGVLIASLLGAVLGGLAGMNYHVEGQSGLLKRFAVTIVGFALLALGVVLMPLPGPGFLVIVLGLIVLATEYVWARRLLVKAKAQAQNAQEAAVASPLRTAGSLLFAVGMMVVGGAMFFGDFIPWPFFRTFLDGAWSPTTGTVLVITGLILLVTTVITLRTAKGKDTTYTNSGGERMAGGSAPQKS